MQPLSSTPIGIMLANSSQIVLWALEKLIDGERPKMEVIDKTTNGADTLRLAKEKQPDILLLDLYLGNEISVNLIPDIIMDGHIRVLIFTGMHDNQDIIDSAILNGASGVVYDAGPFHQNILKAIKRIHENELWLNRSAFSRILMKSLRAREEASTNKEAWTNPDTGKITTLTCRELSIINVFALEMGAPNKRIAEMLCISEQTLRNNLTSIFNKLEIENRSELFMFAKYCHRPG